MENSCKAFFAVCGRETSSALHRAPSEGAMRGEMEIPNPSINFHSASSVPAEFFLWRRFHHLFGGETEDVCGVREEDGGEESVQHKCLIH